MNEKEEARNRLRELLKPGDIVHCILRHVSRSGMFRRISLVKVGKDGSMFHLDGLIVRAGLGKFRGRDEGLVAGGCGMDMGFALVYSLSRSLYGDGFGCIGKGCPSNDHSNGDRDYTEHRAAQAAQALEVREPGQVSDPSGMKGHWHNDGGYALRHQWI